jgi:hypothetical protein
MDGAGFCAISAPQAMSCRLHDDVFEPDERQTIVIHFDGFAAPEPWARSTERGNVTVTAADDPSGALRGETARYAAVLKSSTGSVRNPRPYRPSSQYDLSLALGEATVTRGVDGVYTVRVPVTLRNHTDAYNVGALVRIVPPAGAGFPGVDPPVPCTSICEVPGYRIMVAGEERRFAAVFTLPAATAPGTYEVEITGHLNTNGALADERTPHDNTGRASVVVTV